MYAENERVMLSSSVSHYLQPDYLQPLPTQLDAKKSPLALLAQTCSSIGKDSGNSKSIIPPIEKKDAQKDKDSRKSDSPSSKSGHGEEKGRASSSSSDKREGTPNSTRGDSPKGGFRAPAPKDIPPLVPISSSSDKSSSSDRTSPKTSTSTASERESVSSPSHRHSPSSTSAGHSNSRISLSCGNMLLEVNHHESAAKALGLHSSHPALSGSLKAEGLTAPSALHPGMSAYSSLPFFGHPIPMDPASSMYSGLAGSSLSGLTSAHSHKTGLSPYVSYARVKTTSGATTLVPVCKDPYCTHCQMTMQSAQLASAACGAGCTQCTHEKSFSVPTSLSAAHAGLGGLPLLSHSAASLSLSSLYPHTFGMPAGLPYVCSWMAGSEYCGKRFTTSEELLQHLRTHTSSGEAAAAMLSHSGLAYSALAPGLACHSHFSSPGSLSPNSLRQSYARSLSPNTLLAANRFHPYKSALSMPSPGSALVGSAGLSSLGPYSAYYSPYSLYGQRLGAVAP